LRAGRWLPPTLVFCKHAVGEKRAGRGWREGPPGRDLVRAEGEEKKCDGPSSPSESTMVLKKGGPAENIRISSLVFVDLRRGRE
jgi:hypothetical protein